MTLQELIQRSVDIANAGLTEASASEATAEALLPNVFHAVGVKAAGTERLRTTLRRTKTLTVASGLVTLSSDVLTSYIAEANLLDANDRTKLYSHAPWDQLTTGTLDQRLGYFSTEGESFLHIVEPGTLYDPNSGPSITLFLTIPCTPVVPTLPSDPVDVIEEVVDDLVAALASALKLAASQ